MAVRIRENGQIFCAALRPAMEGDTYLHDTLHHKLSGELKVLVTQAHEEHMERAEWWWRDEVPPGIEIDKFYLEC